MASCKKDQATTSTDRKLTVEVSHVPSGTTYSFHVTNQSSVMLLSATNKTKDSTFTAPAMVHKGDVLTCYYIFNTPGTQFGSGWISFSIDGLPKYSSANGSLTSSFTVN